MSLDLVKMSKSEENLKGIANSFDILLGKPAGEWTQREINIYHLLELTMEKYKVKYSLSQFKLDVRDIKTNVHSCTWYQKSPFQKTLNWCLDQLSIKSYQHSRGTGNFKIIIRFIDVQVNCTIVKKESFLFLVENETTNMRVKNLDNYDQMIQLFGINAKINETKKKQVVDDIANLIREIGLFYN